jgi:hypothetical protein
MVVWLCLASRWGLVGCTLTPKAYDEPEADSRPRFDARVTHRDMAGHGVSVDADVGGADEKWRWFNCTAFPCPPSL